MAIVTCSECGQIIDKLKNTPEEERNPCPACGSTARLIKVHITDSITVHEGLKIKARHGITGKPFLEAKTGDEIYRKEEKWVQRSLRVDRDNDRYTETVVDKETSEVIHHCDEPLRKHRNHGTAKNKRDKNI